MTSNPNSPEVLSEEILADARRESDEIIRRARQEAEALLARAAAEADKARQERLNAARAEAARRSELILATVPVEAGRRRSARVEALLESVYAEVSRQLLARDGFDYRATLIDLAAEAMGRMAGQTFVLKLATADRKAAGDGLRGDVARRTGRSADAITISNENTIAGGGVIVEQTEGHQVWDNRLTARLERLWPELRRQIAMQTSLIAGGGTAGGGA